MNLHSFLDLPDSPPEEADVLLLPLPFEGTACYGKGTAEGPRAIWEASAHIELWDEELDFDLDSLKLHSAAAIVPKPGALPEEYLQTVFAAAEKLQQCDGLVIGIGGEHSLTQPLVCAAAANADYVPADDLSNVTVVQIDAHADLRDSYEGTPHSHACAMRRLVEKGARVIAVGIRSAQREEFEYGRSGGRVQTFFAHALRNHEGTIRVLAKTLSELAGDVYLTIDIDGLEVSLCPATGTPQPGGLGWWQTLGYLRTLLYENRRHRLLGCDLVETVPMPNTQVNEFTAAKLIAKVIAYCSSRTDAT